MIVTPTPASHLAEWLKQQCNDIDIINAPTPINFDDSETQSHCLCYMMHINLLPILMSSQSLYFRDFLILLQDYFANLLETAE